MKNTILITLLTFTLSVSAQEVAPLTLKDAITFALENKAEAKKAKLEVENSEYKIQEAKQYLSNTDYKMLPNYVPKVNEDLDAIIAKRNETREFIRNNNA